MKRHPFYMGDLLDSVGTFFGGDDAGGSSLSDASSSYQSAANDLAKRTAEAQKTAIITGAQTAATGFKQTAAQIESDLTKKLATAAVIGGGLFVLAKHKGWI